MSGNLPVTLGTGCYIAVYPYEGGAYIIGDNAELLGLNVQKDITQAYGTFTFTLSPGGPSGESTPTWTQYLTPQSFVLIGLIRGGVSQIVMMGVILSTSETQVWNQGQVQRATTVQGADLAYFFSNANYYNLTFAFGLPTAGLGGTGQLSALSQGLYQGTPAQLATNWYTILMAGNNGILSTVLFNRGGTSYPFNDVFSYFFEEYPYDISIPSGANFLQSQGSWLSKFLSFCQYPFYEFFVITAPQGTFAKAVQPSSGNVNNTQVPLGSLGNFAAAETFIVGRVSPFPYAANSGTVDKPIWSMQMSRWNALARNKYTNQSFLSSNVGFSNSMVRNFYAINPVAMNQFFGNTQNGLSPFVITQGVWIDQDSIDRYGYQPEVVETEYFYDYDGMAAQKAAAAGIKPTDFAGLVNDLTYRLIGEYLPTPLMAFGSATFPLMPDVLPGTVFTYVPFKDGITWDFYVQGVSHNYVFGGQSTTTLTLTRGLPTSIYQDSKGALLDIFTARAMKQNGVYLKNPKAKGLQFLSLVNANQQITPFGTIQGGVQPT